MQYNNGIHVYTDYTAVVEEPLKRMEESFTIILGTQQKTTHNLRLLACLFSTCIL